MAIVENLLWLVLRITRSRHRTCWWDVPIAKCVRVQEKLMLDENEARVRVESDCGTSNKRQCRVYVQGLCWF